MIQGYSDNRLNRGLSSFPPSTVPRLAPISVPFGEKCMVIRDGISQHYVAISLPPCSNFSFSPFHLASSPDFAVQRPFIQYTFSHNTAPPRITARQLCPLPLPPQAHSRHWLISSRHLACGPNEKVPATTSPGTSSLPRYPAAVSVPRGISPTLPLMNVHPTFFFFRRPENRTAPHHRITTQLSLVPHTDARSPHYHTKPRQLSLHTFSIFLHPCFSRLYTTRGSAVLCFSHLPYPSHLC